MNEINYVLGSSFLFESITAFEFFISVFLPLYPWFELHTLYFCVYSYFACRLLNLPKQYHHEQVPFQVRSLKLWGLQPVSLQIEVSDSGIQVPHR